MNTLKKQRGMSMLGWLVIIGMSVVLFITALKLFPVYMEYYNVLGIIDQIKSDPALKNAPKEKVVSAFTRRLSVADVSLTKDDYSITKIQGRNAYTIQLYYEVRQPLFANLSMVVEFDRSEEVSVE
ncbi:MAG TPA: DUF4845 domain-containing protein [Gammaproteobacteria bacterium]